MEKYSHCTQVLLNCKRWSVQAPPTLPTNSLGARDAESWCVVLHLTKMFSPRPVSWLSLLIGCCTERMQFWIYKPLVQTRGCSCGMFHFTHSSKCKNGVMSNKIIFRQHSCRIGLHNIYHDVSPESSGKIICNHLVSAAQVSLIKLTPWHHHNNNSTDR